MSLNKFTIQKSFAINAGAGSGKTYTLSRRYIVTPEKSTLSLFANYRNLSVNLQSNFHYQ